MSTDKIEKSGTYKYYKYFVIARPMGHRCGYVEIPKYNPFYNISYNGSIHINKKYNRGLPIGKKNPIYIFCFDPDDPPKPQYLLDCHGGLTFSGELKLIPGKYLYGFDAAHAGDGKDFTIMDERSKESYKDFPNFTDDVIRTSDYMESECERLIEDIIKWSRIIKKYK